MISIVRNKYGIPINDIFFSDNPRAVDGESPITFFVQARRPQDGFDQFKTSVINLRGDSGIIFNSLSSNTRYKIKRAEREGYTPSIAQRVTASDIDNFCDFFNLFAAHKRLPIANAAKLHALCAKNSLIFSAITDSKGDTVAMHAYIADSNLERVRLLYSASHFRERSNSEERNAIGRANRLLHWYEIESLGKAGYASYDLGGIPMKNDDPEKNAIARFKSEFGGEHVIEFNGIVCHSRLLQSGLSFARRIWA